MKVVIAGGTSGIGLAVAGMLAQQGATVLITGRDPKKLQRALGSLTGNVEGQCVDSTDTAALQAFMHSAGSIDHLVLALGGNKGAGLIKDLSLPQLREGFEEKLFPQLQTLQAALPYLSTGGSISFITAVSGHARFPGIAGLAAINGALEAIVPVLAKELQPIRVNAVSPGVVDTPWWGFMPEAAKQEAFGQYAKAAPVGRVGKAVDIATMIVQLVSNTFITGQVITVDGGLAL